MSKQPKPTTPKNSFIDEISFQLLNTYMTGVAAAQKEEQELADLMACHIFDLLDWARRHQKNFQTSLADLAYGQTPPLTGAMAQGILPSSIEELESLVDANFYAALAQGDMPSGSNECSERGKLC